MALGVEGPPSASTYQALALHDLAELAEDHLDALEHAVEVARMLGRRHGKLEVVQHQARRATGAWEAEAVCSARRVRLR